MTDLYFFLVKPTLNKLIKGNWFAFRTPGLYLTDSRWQIRKFCSVPRRNSGISSWYSSKGKKFKDPHPTLWMPYYLTFEILHFCHSIKQVEEELLYITQILLQIDGIHFWILTMSLKLSCNWSSAKIWKWRGLMLKIMADLNIVTVSSSLSPQATTARCIFSEGCVFI